MHPRRSQTVHTETLGDEVAVYDGARQQVHALNATAARVWQLCDGATSPAAMAAVLGSELALPEAEAVVNLTLRDLARAHLLEVPGDLPADRRGVTRRALLRRGVAASLLPAIYSIVAPSPVAAQSPPPGPDAPTLTDISPDEGAPDTTVLVTLTGTGFGTTVAVSGTGVTPSNINEISSTSLEVTFTIAANATAGPRNVTVTTAGGTSNALPFTVNALPPPTGDETFDSVGSHTFTVPDRVTTLTVTVRGAQGGSAVQGIVPGGQGGSVKATLTVDPGETLNIRVGGQGETGAVGATAAGGFNGGGAGGGSIAGGGGGASDIRRGGDALSNRVLVAGGGGGGGISGASGGGAGGSPTGGAGADSLFQPTTITGGEGGTQGDGGEGGTNASNSAFNGHDGDTGTGGAGGPGAPGVPGMVAAGPAGGGGGGGYHGGGGGAGGASVGTGSGAGGGGSSFADPAVASDVDHTQGGNTADGEVLIEW